MNIDDELNEVRRRAQTMANEHQQTVRVYWRRAILTKVQADDFSLHLPPDQSGKGIFIAAIQPEAK